MCVDDLWDRLEFKDKSIEEIDNISAFISAFLPEIIIGMRDTNKKTRKIAKTIFTNMLNKMTEFNLLKDFTSVVHYFFYNSSYLFIINCILS